MVIFFDLYVSCVYLVALIGFLNIAYIFPGGFGTIEESRSVIAVEQSDQKLISQLSHDNG